MQNAMRGAGRKQAAAANNMGVMAPANIAPSRPLRYSMSQAINRGSLTVQAVMTPQRTSQASTNGANMPIYTNMDSSTKTSRPRVVVLGSGWGAISFIKALPANIAEKYEVILVSPRNYFLYTPLLPAVATGTMEDRSIVEPVRNLIMGKGDYYEALCKSIDTKAKEIVCCFPADAGLDEACFKMSYDALVLSVGSVNNTFGIKGVAEYCCYFKSIEDANALRRRVSECFERAALPQTPEEERKKLLSFVVVGGGPTGVEVAAEVHDMVYEDLTKLYPNLIKDVKISIIELMDHVLSTYDRKISVYTGEQFKRAGINLVLNSRVAGVRDGYVDVVNKANESTEIPFGACVWATGIAMNPLVKELQQALPGQTHFRSILTDEMFRVNGSDGSIFAVGDAATIDQPKALAHADELFDQADTDRDGKLSLAELRNMLVAASKQFSHLEEHARFLDSQQGMGRWGGMVKKEIASSPLAEVNDTTLISKERFKELLAKIDNGLRALPATAQVARQQGEYLAGLFASHQITGNPATTVLPADEKGFSYNHKGSLAYVGGDKAVMDIPQVGPIFGFAAGVAWKSFETMSQISFRNQCLVMTDWLRTKIFGRDISRV